MDVKQERLGQERRNNQGCLMKIIKYDDAHNVVIEFQDKYKANVHTEYKHFLSGNVKNPYHPSVFNVGMIGNKYPAFTNGKATKEHLIWRHMLERCFDDKFKNKHLAYQNVSCCNEWLIFENFYEWLHSQENFEKWLNNDKWAIDKDILVKGNKIYSPETCCLVPQNVNKLFTKRDALRNDLSIGVRKNGNGFLAQWCNPFTNKKEYSKTYSTIDEAFEQYKCSKESLIKQVAQDELSKGNITLQCHNSMMNYVVEITD